MARMAGRDRGHPARPRLARDLPADRDRAAGALRRRGRGSPPAPPTRESARAATARWSSTAAARTSSSPSSRPCIEPGTSSPRSPRSVARCASATRAPGGDRSDRRLAQRPPHAAHARAQPRGGVGGLDGAGRVRVRVRLRRRRGVRRPPRRGRRARRAAAAGGGARLRPRARRPRGGEAGADPAPARRAGRQGVSRAGGGVDRDLALLRRGGPLRRHDRGAQLPLGRRRSRRS